MNITQVLFSFPAVIKNDGQGSKCSSVLPSILSKVVVLMWHVLIRNLY